MSTADVFHVETVETSSAPRGATPGEWCRYVLANEHSRIVGRYCGTLRQARTNAERLVKQLNDRKRSGKSPYVPRGRAAKAATAAKQAASH
jgi:hypothetical protein